MQKHLRFHFSKRFSLLSEAAAVKAVATFLQPEKQNSSEHSAMPTELKNKKNKNISASGVTHRDESHWR